MDGLLQGGDCGNAGMHNFPLIKFDKGYLL